MSEDYQAGLVATIQHLMLAKGWKPKDLANAIGHESDQYVKRWLLREKAISLASRDRIATALGVSPDEIDPKGEAFDPRTRPAHMRRGGNPLGRPRRPPATEPDAAPPASRSRVDVLVEGEADRAYLIAMEAWWQELSPDDREKVHDFARKIRDERREARKQKAG